MVKAEVTEKLKNNCLQREKEDKVIMEEGVLPSFDLCETEDITQEIAYIPELYGACNPCQVRLWLKYKKWHFSTLQKYSIQQVEDKLIKEWICHVELKWLPLKAKAWHHMIYEVLSVMLC